MQMILLALRKNTQNDTWHLQYIINSSNWYNSID